MKDYINNREIDETKVPVQDDSTYFEITTNNIDTSCKTVLGLAWDTTSDEFVFCFDNLINRCCNMTLTKRNILSVSASVFDPLGMLSPVTAKLKPLFQLLCKDKLDWDDLIPKAIEEVWLKFLSELKNLKEVRSFRYVFSNNFHSGFRVELHGFCDSSKELYCAVVCLRLVSRDDVKVSFLASKTKVAPLKVLTIPRLELLGCLLLSRLLNQRVNSLGNRVNIQNILCWCDSEVALSWIWGKEKSWKPWIENRVVEIRKVVDRSGWKFVKSEENPADIPTRMSSDLSQSFAGCWFQGPSFLLSPAAFSEETVDACACENPLVGRTEVSNFSNVTHEGTTNQACSINAVIDNNRFSSLKKLIIVTGYVLRFLNNLKKRVKQDKDSNVITDEMLTVDEYDDALRMWIKCEQSQLVQQDNHDKLKTSLQLFEDKNKILCLRGRFANTTLTFEEQYPIILGNKQSHFTRLIILDAHEETKHHGVETTLAHIRRNYWIVKGRKAVQRISTSPKIDTIRDHGELSKSQLNQVILLRKSTRTSKW